MDLSRYLATSIMTSVLANSTAFMRSLSNLERWRVQRSYFAEGIPQSHYRPPQILVKGKTICACSTSTLKDTTPLVIPSSIYDLAADDIRGFGANLAEDHPGYGDADYIARRRMICKTASDHKMWQPIPRLEYLPHEKECWGNVLRRLTKLYPTHACKEFLANFQLYNFREDEVVQLEDVSQLLKKRTGWQLLPVAGLLHPRQFLNGMAFKALYSTAFMRHSSQPFYTPEPDVCHELLGHTIMLANPDYADLVQAIGVASLGADPAQIYHLTKIYWYTVEFGVVREGKEIKAFGAGLLSSYGELANMRSGNPGLWPFNPFSKQPRMLYKHGIQPGYFVLDSFQMGAAQLHEYCRSITPPEIHQKFFH